MTYVPTPPIEIPTGRMLGPDENRVIVTASGSIDIQLPNAQTIYTRRTRRYVIQNPTQYPVKIQGSLLNVTGGSEYTIEPNHVAEAMASKRGDTYGYMITKWLGPNDQTAGVTGAQGPKGDAGTAGAAGPKGDAGVAGPSLPIGAPTPLTATDMGRNGAADTGVPFQLSTTKDGILNVAATLSGGVLISANVAIFTSATQNGTYVKRGGFTLSLTAAGLLPGGADSTIPVPAGHWVRIDRTLQGVGSTLAFTGTKWLVGG